MRTHVAELREDERQGLLAAAEAALETGGESFTDRGLGRSRLYGHHYLGWTRPLLQAYALTGETRWLHSWGEIFDRWYAVRDEVHGDWPGLDVIWYTLGVASRTRLFADALDLGGAALPAATRIRLLGSVLGGARWLADEHDSFRYGNWQVVGVCCLATLAALFPEFAEAPTWAGVARERIEEHLALDIDDDGGHLERSPGYHRLCLTSLHDAALHARGLPGLGSRPPSATEAHARLAGRPRHARGLAAAVPGLGDRRASDRCSSAGTICSACRRTRASPLASSRTRWSGRSSLPCHRATATIRTRSGRTPAARVRSGHWCTCPGAGTS